MGAQWLPHWLVDYAVLGVTAGVVAFNGVLVASLLRNTFTTHWRYWTAPTAPAIPLAGAALWIRIAGGHDPVWAWWPLMIAAAALAAWFWYRVLHAQGRLVDPREIRRTAEETS